MKDDNVDKLASTVLPSREILDDMKEVKIWITLSSIEHKLLQYYIDLYNLRHPIHGSKVGVPGFIANVIHEFCSSRVIPVMPKDSSKRQRYINVYGFERLDQDE